MFFNSFPYIEEEYYLGRSDYWKFIWDPPSVYSMYYSDYVEGWLDSEYLDSECLWEVQEKTHIE